MKKLHIEKGEKVLYNGKACVIVKIISISKVSIEEIDTNIVHTVNVSKLEIYDDLVSINESLPIHQLDKMDWDKAMYRYEVIKPILENRGRLDLIKETSKKYKISLSTIYRWIKLYDQTSLVSNLVGGKYKGHPATKRLPKKIDEIINDKIHSVYLNTSRKSIEKTIREILITCNSLGITAPHPNTIRKRITNISSEEKIRKRFGSKLADNIYEPIKGSFPGADYPLSVVQIDHTPVDIILVDEVNRNPLKRPWLTLAIDVYSRMVVGFYLSFESPGAHGTGICIANSILPKEMWLAEQGIDADWPCWGIMDVIHVDNAKEFRGEMLKQACIQYGINLEFRPVATPHFGGHVERLLGTFAKEIHNLPGTTFSNQQERNNYESEKNASFTLLEFEKWLTIFITKIYHQRIHSGIKDTPLNKYSEGFLNKNGNLSHGVPPRIFDERRTRLDFMPIVERSIQEYGIVIDHIYYYNEILRPFVHDEDGKNQRIKHIFKRDPRDLSKVYFYHKEFNDYYEIQYRNTTLPPMTIWEHNYILSTLKKNKIVPNEESIFNAFRELNEMESKVIRETKRKKRNSKFDMIEKPIENITSKISIPSPTEKDEIITPFDNIDDEAFN